VEVLIDVDVGLGRTGVGSAAAALALAAHVDALLALQLVGVQGTAVTGSRSAAPSPALRPFMTECCCCRASLTRCMLRVTASTQ
jgi:D-serine deaminase-like pyridoxal phosphate-dependent protein